VARRDRERGGRRARDRRVTPGGPAARAGVQPGATIKAVNGAPAKSLADFYRKVWATGGAGSCRDAHPRRRTARSREVAITPPTGSRISS
jgi:S1-C subfamily serine protease